MDLVTHAMGGLVLAAPLMAQHPLAGCALAIGTVLPDIDAIARFRSKHAFLRSHQTWSHAPMLILSLGVLGTLLMHAVGALEPWWPAALAGGMMLHVLMDVTNTYGLAMAWPFSRRRYSLQWLFFIDAIVLGATWLAFVAGVLPLLRYETAVPEVSVAYAAFLLAYWVLRRAVWRRANRLQPTQTRTLVPSALVPWRFYGYARYEKHSETFQLNVLTGRTTDREIHSLYDESYQDWLLQVPEYVLMRELSPGYHVVHHVSGPDGITLTCRDLRTVNFGGRFGMLEITFDADGQVRDKVFHA